MCSHPQPLRRMDSAAFWKRALALAFPQFGLWSAFLPQSALCPRRQRVSRGEVISWTLNCRAASQQEKLPEACALCFDFLFSPPRALGDWRMASTMWPNVTPKKTQSSVSCACFSPHPQQRPHLSKGIPSLFHSSRYVLVDLPTPLSGALCLQTLRDTTTSMYGIMESGCQMLKG